MSSRTSSTVSGTPAPNIAPATQVIPSIGLNGKPTTAPSPSSDNGGDHFPTAAAAVLGIFGGILGLFLVYKIYRCTHRRWRDASAAQEPPLPEAHARSLPTSPMAAGFASLPSQMSVAFNGGGFDGTGRRSSGTGTFGGNRQESWGGESWGGFDKGDISPSPPYVGTPVSPGTPPSREDPFGSANGSRASLAVFPASSSRASFGGGPAPGMPRRSFYSSSAAGSTLLHSRAPSTFSVSSPQGGGNGRDFASGNRIAGAPHNPASRIEVVPPTPLAPPPGTVIATDKSTLDFAPSSGIGRGGPAEVGREEWFAAAAAAGQGREAQEHLNTAFDGAYGGASGSGAQQQRQQEYPPHSFPPTASSSAGSSSVPRSAPRAKRASHSNLRAGAGASANSSDSNLSSASFTPHSQAHALPPPVGSAGRAPPSLAVRTSNSGLREEAAEPRSPLEKLQMRAEREAKGLSARSEELRGVQEGFEDEP